MRTLSPGDVALRAAALVAALLALIAIGSSRHIYHATIPHDAPYAVQVALRKAESLIAFAAAGALIEALLPARRLPGNLHPVLRGGLLVGIVSFAIELSQVAHHSREPLAEHLFDVCCGALGGFAGAAAIVALRAKTALGGER